MKIYNSHQEHVKTIRLEYVDYYDISADWTDLSKKRMTNRERVCCEILRNYHSKEIRDNIIDLKSDTHAKIIAVTRRSGDLFYQLKSKGKYYNIQTPVEGVEVEVEHRLH